MSSSPAYPITDNHMHVDPVRGLGPLEVAKLFVRSGGTHILVVNKGVGFEDLESFVNSTALFLKCVEQMNRGAALRAFAVVGPHPAQLVKLWNAQDPDTAVSVMTGALSHSARIIREGSAVALGEVGRPHFEVPDEILAASNHLLDLALELAADIGCAVQCHMETSTPEQFTELAKRARSAGLPESKVVRHFSGPVRSGASIIPSIIATRRMIESALNEIGPNFMMETDYMDDASRPGAVLGPRSVPRLTRLLMEEGVMDERAADRVHRELVENTYGVELSV